MTKAGIKKTAIGHTKLENATQNRVKKEKTDARGVVMGEYIGTEKWRRPTSKMELSW
jgi:hypothetical protein